MDGTLITTISELLKLGGRLVSLQLGPKLYVEGPRSPADWGIRFTFTLLFPR